MNSRPISTLALIGTTLCSSHKVLALLKSVPFQTSISEAKMREAVYLAYNPWAAREPDHVFERSWKILSQQPANMSRNWYVPGALQAISSEFLAPRHGSLYVKLEKFGAWQQSVASRICSLPVQAAGHTWRPNGTYLQPLETPSWLRNPDSDSWASAHLPVLTPYDPLVEDYLDREGLHETHLHLNGSTHAEQCWLRALCDPSQEIKDFETKWGKDNSSASRKVRELALTVNPQITPTELRSQLYSARCLRGWLVSAATGTLPADATLPCDYAALTDKSSSDSSAPAPGEARFALHVGTSAADELNWLHLLLRRLDSDPSTILERMLHLYLLLQNQYYRLLVQSEEQFGFDQFQKLTWTTLREQAEGDYLNRFLAMHGKRERHSRIAYLEGRFAPKASAKENEELMGEILKGYWRYLIREDKDVTGKDSGAIDLAVLLENLDAEIQSWSSLDRKHMRLSLVAHFIKQPWDSQSKSAGPYRFYSLRKDLENRAHALINTLNSRPRLRIWLRGIDAAANELHTPPEVFASTFRLCRQGGLTRRSYHVGEDFPHLLTGLRHMLDALELLDLKDGDRIGHGTAMGISPELWLARMPDELIVTKGDWMLDLLATWRLLRRSGATADAYRVECELASLASQLFKEDLSCMALERAMAFRGLNLKYIQKIKESNWTPDITPLNDSEYSEAMQASNALRDHPLDVEILWKWQSDSDLWKRSETLIRVPSDFLPPSVYVMLQQALMQEVADRRVIIETLPSSNVRISQYLNFAEHHSLRWMRVPEFIRDGDPAIMVSLGSDDPGIFAGDLNSEFYQLYATLRGIGLSDMEALAYLSPLNERGRQYRFHDPTVG